MEKGALRFASPCRAPPLSPSRAPLLSSHLLGLSLRVHGATPTPATPTLARHELGHAAGPDLFQGGVGHLGESVPIGERRSWGSVSQRA